MMFMGIVGQLSGSLDCYRSPITRRHVLGLLDPKTSAIYIPSDHVPIESKESFCIAGEYNDTTIPWGDESETNRVDAINGEKDLFLDWHIEHLKRKSLVEFGVSEATDSSIFEDPPVTTAATFPASAEFLLCLFVKGDELDAIIGDLTERYFRLFGLLGKGQADLHTFIDVARLLYHIGKRALMKTSVRVILGK